MPDIDEVINGLEKLQEVISRTKSLWTEPTVEALEDALELLKQQHGLMLALEQSNASNEYLNNSVSELGETINILKDEIKRLKEQQPKKGHWIEVTDFDCNPYYDCSVCGVSWTMIDGTPEGNGMKYCPRCGARMDGEQE